jgi:hypothetical protein
VADESIRTDGTDPIPTREWVKGIVVVLAVVGITIVLPLVLLIAWATCGCGTRPA